MNRRKRWQRIEEALQSYQLHWSPMRWFGNWGGHTKGKAELWIFVRLLLLLSLLMVASLNSFGVGPYRPVTQGYVRCGISTVLFVATVFLLADIVLANTATAFFGSPNRQMLRSAFLLVVAYLELQVGFATFYVMSYSDFKIPEAKEALKHPMLAIYTSLAMLVSPSIITPREPLAAVVVVFQLATGFYFVATLVSTVLSISRSSPLLSPVTEMEPKSDDPQ